MCVAKYIFLIVLIHLILINSVPYFFLIISFIVSTHSRSIVGALNANDSPQGPGAFYISQPMQIRCIRIFQDLALILVSCHCGERKQQSGINCCQGLIFNCCIFLNISFKRVLGRIYLYSNRLES